MSVVNISYGILVEAVRNGISGQVQTDASTDSLMNIAVHTETKPNVFSSVQTHNELLPSCGVTLRLQAH